MRAIDFITGPWRKGCLVNGESQGPSLKGAINTLADILVYEHGVLQVSVAVSLESPMNQ